MQTQEEVPCKRYEKLLVICDHNYTLTEDGKKFRVYECDKCLWGKLDMENEKTVDSIKEELSH